MHSISLSPFKPPAGRSFLKVQRSASIAVSGSVGRTHCIGPRDSPLNARCDAHWWKWSQFRLHFEFVRCVRSSLFPHPPMSSALYVPTPQLFSFSSICIGVCACCDNFYLRNRGRERRFLKLFHTTLLVLVFDQVDIGFFYCRPEEKTNLCSIKIPGEFCWFLALGN